MVVQRANPGWRLEAGDAKRVVAYGEENPHEAVVAQFVAAAAELLPSLLQELAELRSVLPALGGELAGLSEINLGLRNALGELADGIDDESLPDWFSLEIRAALARHGLESDLGTASGCDEDTAPVTS